MTTRIIAKSGSDTKPKNYFQNLRKEMLDFLPDKVHRVLDVGCGDGVFACEISRLKGAETWGLEIDQAAAKRARQTLDKVLVGDIGVLLNDLPKGHFDLIVFNDVLEHMVDPFHVLSEVRSKLSKDGYVLSSIPNIRYFHTLYALVMGGEWEYAESGILDRTHLRFFTSKSIQNMYERLGYSIVRHEGINPMPTHPKHYKALMAMSKKKFDDIQYEQFATLAQVKSGTGRR